MDGGATLGREGGRAYCEKATKGIGGEVETHFSPAITCDEMT